MTTTGTGRKAESAAAAYLAAKGFSIIERNFRTPRCEIDIIASKHRCLYFIEVKYRATTRQGGGLDYVTSAKQRQMHYAAEQWLQAHDWPGEVTLAAMEVSGPDFVVDQFIDSIAA